MGTTITSTTGMKDTEARANPTQKTSTSTYRQSDHPLGKASDTPSTMNSLPPPARTCHSSNSTYYTRNETQAAYANSFCNGVAALETNMFEIKIFQSEIETQLYMYTIEWIPNCNVTDFHTYSMAYCSEIMRQNYIECNNGGMGGYADWNCLRFRFQPLHSYIDISTNGTIIV
ncbi:hypothetical protein V8C42DRAFT_337181 [Trichoderma barbatum]